MAVSLFSDNSDYYYLFDFIININNNYNYKFIIQKHKFNSIENITNERTMELSIIYKKNVKNSDTEFSYF